MDWCSFWVHSKLESVFLKPKCLSSTRWGAAWNQQLWMKSIRWQLTSGSDSCWTCSCLWMSLCQVSMAMLRKLGVTLCRQEISKLSSSWFAKGQDGSRGGRDLARDVKQGVNVWIWGCILLEQWVLIGNRSCCTHPRWASMQNGFTQCIETSALGSSESTASGSGANQRLISARVSIFVRWHAQSPRKETIARKQDMNRSMQVRST